MEETIQFEPERRKGDQPARFGRGRPRGPMTPNEQAALNLSKALEDYPEFTKEAREMYKEEFTDMPSLRTMNMKVMAATLSFLRGIDDQATPDNFKDDVIVPYLEKLLPPVSSDPEKEMERQRLIIRYKAQLLMYIIAINDYRQTIYEESE